MPNPLWMMSGQTIHNYYGYNSVRASALLDDAAVFSTGTVNNQDPRQDGFYGTPVMVYSSFDTFSGDVGNIDTGIFQWLMYDLEQIGSMGPYPDDQQDPIQYLQRFGMLAHSHGFRTIAAPGRDLGNTVMVNGKTMGETNDHWYLRVGIPLVSAQFHDIVLIQGQGDEQNQVLYQTLVGGALSQIAQTSVYPDLGNPYCLPFVDLSTNQGNGGQMYTAWRWEDQSDGVVGVYLSAQNTMTQLGYLDTFLSNF